MRIGGKKEFEQESSLHDYVNNMGQGLLAIPDKNHIPQDMLLFAISQYQRFGIPYNKDIEDVVRVGCFAMVWVFDFVDPYAFLAGVSDVEITDTWAKHQFLLSNGKRQFYADPNNLESFQYIPGADEASFNHYMARPGVDQLPFDIPSHLEMIFDGEYGGDYLDQLENGKAEDVLKKLCTLPDGSLDHKKFRAYFNLAAWAAFCWMIGPLAREWRHNFHDIFYLCRKHGECILYEGVPVDPEHYKKFARAPQSCAVCSLDAWCVEVSQVAGRSEYICEKCLNGNLPLYGGATCGTKACRFSECPYHPNHGQLYGTYLAHRGAGQLVSMARENRALIPQTNNVKLISG